MKYIIEWRVLGMIDTNKWRKWKNYKTIERREKALTCLQKKEWLNNFFEYRRGK